MGGGRRGAPQFSWPLTAKACCPALTLLQQVPGRADPTVIIITVKLWFVSINEQIPYLCSAPFQSNENAHLSWQFQVLSRLQGIKKKYDRKILDTEFCGRFEFFHIMAKQKYEIHRWVNPQTTHWVNYYTAIKNCIKIKTTAGEMAPWASACYSSVRAWFWFPHRYKRLDMGTDTYNPVLGWQRQAGHRSSLAS